MPFADVPHAPVCARTPPAPLLFSNGLKFTVLSMLYVDEAAAAAAASAVAEPTADATVEKPEPMAAVACEAATAATDAALRPDRDESPMLLCSTFTNVGCMERGNLRSTFISMEVVVPPPLPPDGCCLLVLPSGSERPCKCRIMSNRFDPQATQKAHFTCANESCASRCCVSSDSI